MVISLMVFAHLKPVLGAECRSVNLPEGATVNHLLERLLAECPALREWLPSLRVAVNCEYAALDTVLHEGDEVALIPPVSGG